MTATDASERAHAIASLPIAAAWPYTLVRMIDVFLHAVFPVFAVVLIGFAGAKRGLFDSAMAAAVNRFVFYVPLPVLLFRLIASARLDTFQWSLLGAYFVVEVAVYATGFAIARVGFGRPARESLLIGMTGAFANHVFFVLPIAQALFGEAAAVPIVTIIIVDAVVLFGGTTMIMEATGADASGAPFLRLVAILARNPAVIAIAAGIAALLIGIPITGGLDLFTDFVGSITAPASLFALGVIMAARDLHAKTALPFVMSGLKLLVMPAAAWALMVHWLEISPALSTPALMAAAGPAGAMPFVLALQYGQPTGTIARIILYTTIGSLLTVSWLGQGT